MLFRSIGFKKGVEHKKSQVWDRVSFLLAMAGLVLFPNNIQSFRMEEDHINIIGLDNKRMKVHYNKLTEFDRDTKDYLMVYDWFAVSSALDMIGMLYQILKMTCVICFFSTDLQDLAQGQM